MKTHLTQLGLPKNIKKVKFLVKNLHFMSVFGAPKMLLHKFYFMAIGKNIMDSRTWNLQGKYL